MTMKEASFRHNGHIQELRLAIIIKSEVEFSLLLKKFHRLSVRGMLF